MSHNVTTVEFIDAFASSTSALVGGRMVLLLLKYAANNLEKGLRVEGYVSLWSTSGYLDSHFPSLGIRKKTGFKGF
jgi:hypothetical protein